MHKVCLDNLIASMFIGNFKEKVLGFIATDKTFCLLGCIKGTYLPRKICF